MIIWSGYGIEELGIRRFGGYVIFIIFFKFRRFEILVRFLEVDFRLKRSNM